MMDNSFRLQVIIRELLLAASIIGAFLLWLKTPFYLSAILVLLLAIYQIFRLIHYVEQTNRKLSQFLDSIRHSDFSRSFSSPGLGSSFAQLDESFQKVIEAFEKQRMDKQVQLKYLQAMMHHVNTALISFNHKGGIELFNNAAKKLFDVPSLQHIEDLSRISDELLDTAKSITINGREVVQVSVNNKTMQLAIRGTTFHLRDKQYKLISFQDISPELEEKEMESWQKLARVLAHEIMNSITPIASLSETVRMLLQTNMHENEKEYTVEKETINDVSEALDTIGTRSEGLIQFVNAYRNFTKVPDPKQERFGVKEMLQRVQNLNRGQEQEKHITIKVTVQPETLELTADPNLIEQALINLTKNAFSALEDQPNGVISLLGETDSRGNILIQVSDNGPGIPQENLDKIFIPFYSTRRPYKQGNSGIGLSLSRKILRAHKGELTVQSTRGEGTTFTLEF